MFKPFSFFLFFVFIGLIFQVLQAQELEVSLKKFSWIRSQHRLEIYAEKTSSPFAKKVAESWSQIEDQIQQGLGLRFSRTVSLYLCSSDTLFKEIFGGEGEWVSAFAIPEYDLILLRTNKVDPIHNYWKDTLVHELTHLVMFDYQHRLKKVIPKWYHEGVAEAVSRQSHFDTEQKDLALSSYYDQIPALDQISDHFRENSIDIRLDYAISRSICSYLEKRFGFQIHTLLLQALEKEKSFKEAVFQVTKVPWYEIEKEWKDHLKESFSWWDFLGANLSLFTFIPLLLIFLYLKKRKEARHIYQQWEQQQQEEEEEDLEIYPKY